MIESVTAKRPATVRRSAADRYDVRVPCESSEFTDWAIIFVSEENGVLSILSDFGSWSHFWSSHGRPTFRHFLMDMATDHNDYLMRKLGGTKKAFDAESSARRVKEQILRWRRDNADRKEAARTAWDLLDELEQSMSAHEFGDVIRDSDELSEILGPDWYEWTLVYDHESGLKAFVERIWPVFVMKLREELGEISHV